MSYSAADMSLWQGRTDTEETGPSTRWHQNVQQLPLADCPAGSLALLGFACDEGVRRNKGRQGAKEGPQAIRTALANAAWHHKGPVYDAGDVHCEGEQLEDAQQDLAQQISALLDRKLKPMVMGGGHEIAWASFQGIAQHIYAKQPNAKIGIINLDAHLDLRTPSPQPSSGTPFRQIAEWCKEHKKPFNYYCIGVNESANTEALFDFARERGVRWWLDRDCKATDLRALRGDILEYVSTLDYVYFTICLDVFSAAAAPGVSAPSIMGFDPVLGLDIARIVAEEARGADVPVILTDIAECNPQLDQDGRTSKLAARLLFELAELV